MLHNFSDLIAESYKYLQLQNTVKQYSSGDYYYEYKNVKAVQNAVRNLLNAPEVANYFEQELKAITQTALYTANQDQTNISSTDNSKIVESARIIRTKLEVLIRQILDSKHLNSRNELAIKLPEIKTFDDLGKVASEFKKAVEIPVLENNIGDIEINSATEGSIILYVSVATASALALVANICWAASVLRKKFAEAKMFEAHARTLELKNNELEVLLDAQKRQWSNILENEATAIANKHYNSSEPELVRRLELSVKTMADLIDRGAQLIPSNNDSETKKLFPDYTSLGLIESTIKQITEK